MQPGQSVLIPTDNEGGFATFSKAEITHGSWGTNRDSDLYNALLFSDRYEMYPNPTPGLAPLTRERDPDHHPVAGGLENALGSGRTVLDIGSGEAVALLQYAQQFPKTTFIGIDSGYIEVHPLDMTKPGVQLTKDDWRTLETVSDNSIDTILAAQSAFMWGICNDNGTPNPENTSKILNAITRVAKSNAILRYDLAGKKNAHITQSLQDRGWTTTVADRTVVAIKGQMDDPTKSLQKESI